MSAEPASDYDVTSNTSLTTRRSVVLSWRHCVKLCLNAIVRPQCYLRSFFTFNYKHSSSTVLLSLPDRFELHFVHYILCNQLPIRFANWRSLYSLVCTMHGVHLQRYDFNEKFAGCNAIRLLVLFPTEGWAKRSNAAEAPRNRETVDMQLDRRVGTAGNHLKTAWLQWLLLNDVILSQEDKTQNRKTVGTFQGTDELDSIRVRCMLHDKHSIISFTRTTSDLQTVTGC